MVDERDLEAANEELERLLHEVRRWHLIAEDCDTAESACLHQLTAAEASLALLTASLRSIEQEMREYAAADAHHSDLQQRLCNPASATYFQGKQAAYLFIADRLAGLSRGEHLQHAAPKATAATD